LRTPPAKAQKRDTFKRLTKLVLSGGFFLFMSAANLIRRLTGRKPLPTCVILDYHAVACEERKQFAGQMDALLRWTTPIAADSRKPLSLGRRYAAVTFDDGLQCVLQNAIPELVQRRIPATLFVVANLLGSKPNWTMFGEDYDDHEPIAHLEQLKALPADLIAIGSHTLSHPWLPSLIDSEAKTELAGSRDLLKNLMSRDIRLFSFPYGASTERLVGLCREAGYERVFTIMPTLALVDPQEFVSGRVVVDPSDWPLEFRLKLLGAYQWLPRVFSWKRKLFPESVHRPSMAA
jgi:peptidoglycan/xylan/chitin deacetylase (PgdA/CDA1 family)